MKGKIAVLIAFLASTEAFTAVDYQGITLKQEDCLVKFGPDDNTAVFEIGNLHHVFDMHNDKLQRALENGHTIYSERKKVDEGEELLVLKFNSQGALITAVYAFISPILLQRIFCNNLQMIKLPAKQDQKSRR